MLLLQLFPGGGHVKGKTVAPVIPPTATQPLRLESKPRGALECVVAALVGVGRCCVLCVEHHCVWVEA